MVRSILRQSLPRWYDLRLRNHSIVLEIHPNLIPEVVEKVTRSIERREEQIQFEGTPLSNKARWGYTSTCRNVEPKTPGWIAVECELPFGNHRKSASCAKTLEVLLQALGWPKTEVEDTGSRQLLVVTGLLTLGSLGGWALSIDIGNELYLWTKDQKVGSNPEIISTMKKVWMRLDGRKTVKHWSERSFQGYLHENGGLYLSVPGNATDLTPGIGSLGDINDIGDGFQIGYRLEPHNIDGPLQQLALLAGVVKFRELSGL